MTSRGLLIAMIAVFASMLVWTSTVPPSGPALAAALSGTANSGTGDDDGNPIEGRRIFVRENCYTCHGGFAGGAMCPSLREDPPDESDVRDAVLEGTPNGMPSFRGRVTRREIEDLAAYFDTLRTAQEPTFTHWWEARPTR